MSRNWNAAREFGRSMQGLHLLQEAVPSDFSGDDLLFVLNVNVVPADAQPKKVTVSGLASAVTPYVAISGVSRLDELSDVDIITVPPTDGQALVYSSGTGEWIAGSAGATAAGSANEIQYNDGASGLAASADFTWDDSAKELGVGGDINLDDGGTYTTTVQTVTPTANRTISFPDATGTVALVAGSNQAVQYNSAGANAGDSGLLYDATSGSLTVGGKTVTTDAPVINLSQTWNNAATTFTGLKLNVTNTASASTSNLLDVQTGGVTRFSVGSNPSINALRYGLANFGINFPGGYVNILDYDGNTIISWLKKTTNIGVNLSAKLSWGPNYFTPDIALDRDSAGVVKITDGTTGTGYIKQVPVAVSALPSAATVGAGTRGFVNDATATTFASTVTGGGANTVPVYSDGTNWLIG